MIEMTNPECEDFLASNDIPDLGGTVHRSGGHTSALGVKCTANHLPFVSHKRVEKLALHNVSVIWQNHGQSIQKSQIFFQTLDH